jgi:hypothetical protein
MKWTFLLLSCLSLSCSKDKSELSALNALTEKAPNDDKPLAPNSPLTVGDLKHGLQALAQGGKQLSAAAEQDRLAVAQQIQVLDGKIAAIQDLIAKGRYDDAELQLVDIHWKPVSSGTNENAAYAGQYETKRRALERIVSRKRAAR